MIGSLGERLAAEHLARAGYEIVERNFRTRAGELDLVVSGGRWLVFCEVKTRVVGSRCGPAEPLDAIGPDKRRRLRRMAGQWLAARGDTPRTQRPELRFDAIGITVSRGGRLLRLDHVEGAF
jgi:putative endonuclease